MEPVDLGSLVEFLTLMLGDAFHGIGSAYKSLAVDALWMDKLTTGIFGENGGLIYWLNDKLLWMLEEILAGLSFTVAG